MQKKGSQFLTVFLLIIIAIATISGIYFIIENQDLEDAQTKFNCVKDVKIEILNACYENNLLKIKTKNKEDIILGDFFLVLLDFNNGTSEKIPTPYNTYIMPYETKTIIIPYYEGLNTIRLIPRIEKQNYLCLESAPEFKNITECKEN